MASPPGYQDPLSARFSGVSGGNPNLEEETAKTFTIGVVLQPRFLPGLTLSVDYWDIEIEDAISAVSANDIVNNCYDTVTFPDNQYCGLFTRNRDTTSPQFLGFNFLRQTQVNFGAIEGSGYDFTGRYQFNLGDHEFALTASGTYMNELDYFFDPADPIGARSRAARDPASAAGGPGGPELAQWPDERGLDHART
jgi:iron complex outermembrane recepter protein